MTYPEKARADAVMETPAPRLVGSAPSPFSTCLPRPELRLAVQDVVVVVSSSRGGSSFLMETLRRAPELVHIRGEVNSLLALAGMKYPAGGFDSDESPTVAFIERLNPDGLSMFQELLFREAGWPTDELAQPEALDRFSQDLTFRLSIQWPEERFDEEYVRECMIRSFERLVRHHGCSRMKTEDETLFFLVFLSLVRPRHPRVNPYYYDIPVPQVRKVFGNLSIPTGPPSDAIVEEPPFIVPRPWQIATPTSFVNRLLILGAPSNAYRLQFLRTFFPNAQLRVLHLTRNPAASINGLIDGWKYRGFHSHAVGGLRIRGYSGADPCGRRWWKFDLPPGWRAYTRASLAEVCAFQWRSAHQAILKYVDNNDVSYCQIHFEDLVGSTSQRRKAFETVSRFLIGTGKLERLGRSQTKLVMATTPPASRRWMRRAEEILPQLGDCHTEVLLERCGYANDPNTWQ